MYWKVPTSENDKIQMAPQVFEWQIYYNSSWNDWNQNIWPRPPRMRLALH
jgi:hypothetical protein